MKRRFPVAAAILPGLLLAPAAIGANEKLSLRVTPNVSSAPSTVVVQATVEPNADNRRLHIEADSGSFLRSSDIQLEGDKAPVVTELRIANLPSGEYTVTAVLSTNAGTETTVRRTALVIGRFREHGN